MTVVMRKKGFGLIFEIGLFTCGLKPFDIVYPRQVFERCFRFVRIVFVTSQLPKRDMFDDLSHAEKQFCTHV